MVGESLTLKTIIMKKEKWEIPHKESCKNPQYLCDCQRDFIKKAIKKRDGDIIKWVKKQKATNCFWKEEIIDLFLKDK